MCIYWLKYCRELQEKESTVPRPPLATAVFLRPVSSSEANNNNTEEDTTPRQAEDTPVPRERQPLVRTVPHPPKDLPQEALNRVFTDELLKAKMRLKSSQTPTPGRSQETGGGSEGVPPPPPPPVLPPGLRPAAGGKGRAAVAQPPPPEVNPREELLLAIRRVGGAGGLRKTRN